MQAQLSPEQTEVGLRVLKQVAIANGTFADEERALLASAARALGVHVDVDELAPVEPDETARVFEEAGWRQRLVQAMVVMALIDGEASADEVKLIDRFAHALEVKDPRVHNMHQLLSGRLGWLRFDVLRRQPLAKRLLRDWWRDEGLEGAWKIFKMAALGKTPEDPELAWRYKQLGLLPRGTLGREFWEHMTERKFAFPGEPAGIPERFIHHELTHVLTGYDTDPSGETQIAAFYAGYYKEDPFAFIFLVLLMYHLDVKVSPVVPPSRGMFDPDQVLRAMERGRAINIDLTDRWDHWSVIELPIDVVRRRYNVLE